MNSSKKLEFDFLIFIYLTIILRNVLAISMPDCLAVCVSQTVKCLR